MNECWFMTDLKLGKGDGVSMLWCILYSWILSESLPCGLPFILPSYYVLKFSSACLHQDLKIHAVLKAPNLLSSRQSYTRKFWLGMHNVFVQTTIPRRRFSSRQSTPAAWPPFRFCRGTLISPERVSRQFLTGSFGIKKWNRLNAIVSIYALVPPFCCLVTELFHDPQRTPASTQIIGTAFFAAQRELSSTHVSINHSLNLTKAGIS